MVVEIVADTWSIGDHGNPVRLKERCRAKPRKLQQLRRIERARSDDHLRISARAAFVVADDILDAGRASAVEQDARGERFWHHLEICTASRLLEIAGRGRGPHAIAHGGLVIARAFLRRSVEIVIARISALQRRLDVSLDERMTIAQIRNRERPAGTVEFICTALVVLRLAEIGEDVIETPTGIAQLAPMVKILRLSADIDQSVDRTGSTKNLAARRNDLPIAALGLRLGRITPIEPAIAEKFAKAEWNMKPRVEIAGARLQHKHSVAARRRQPIGQNAPGAAGPHDDEVESL